MIQPLEHVAGPAYPFGEKNVDTDIIIPARFLKKTNRLGMGAGAFETIRARLGNVFDDPRYSGAAILIAGENFACGSSREHAAWAIVDLGIRVVIAPSFSDIFSGNAYKNGILTVVLPREAIDRLLDDARAGTITVDLPTQTVTSGKGAAFTFEIDEFRKQCLLAGLDEIALTLTKAPAITAYEAEHAADMGWMDRRLTQ